jgi:CheY-like chemotaxis protein
MNPACALPRILIVERDDELLQALATLLQEEGYEVFAAPSLNDALKQLDSQVFSLALVDLFARYAPRAFTEGHILRRRAHPTPIGLLTTQNLAPEEATHQGFAFLLREPFEIEDLLSLVATTIKQPLSLEQQRLAQIVWRFFTALQNADWQTIATLCTEDLAYYPATSSSLTLQRKIQGLSAYIAYAEAARCTMPDSHYDNIMTFARPKGLAARFRVSWTSPGGTHQQMTGATLFHFREERISQIGNHQNTQLVRALARNMHAG